MDSFEKNGHAWYVATIILKNDGEFKFHFDYDHLPVFDYMPSPAHWDDEFKRYPRPELQVIVQDWIDGKVDYERQHDEYVEKLKELAKK